MANVTRSSFNSHVQTYLSNKAKGIINWHSGKMPAQTTNSGSFQNTAKYDAKGVASGPSTAASAIKAITDTANTIAQIRRIEVGYRNYSSVSNHGYGYASLSSAYSINLQALINKTITDSGIKANSTIKQSTLTNSLNNFYNTWINTVVNSGTLDFRMCHSNTAPCHSSGRGRR